MNKTYITVGKVGTPFGVHGWVKIQSFTELEASIFDFKPWYLSKDQKSWDIYQIEASKPHGKGFIVKIKGINSPEAARPFTGYYIAVTRDQFPTLAKNEYYWTDLIGLTVIDQHNHVLGKVKYLMETGSNDVLVVEGEQEIAIPYLPDDVILSIDLDKKEIHVCWDI